MIVQKLFRVGRDLSVFFPGIPSGMSDHAQARDRVVSDSASPVSVLSKEEIEQITEKKVEEYMRELSQPPSEYGFL